MKDRIEILNDRIIIHQEAAGSAYIIPLIITLIAFLVPLSFIPIAIILGDFDSSDIPGLLFSSAIFWAVGFYTGRQYLWGKFGKEILWLKPNHIIYEPDFKYFKGRKRSIDMDKTKLSIHQLQGKMVIGFEEKDSKFHTVIKLQEKDLKILMQTLIERYDLE